MPESKKPEPPKPPKIKHNVSFYPHQVVGMIVIIIIPLLALLGMFGTTQGKESASSEALSLEIEYPERFRYKTIDPLEISVENISNETQIVTVTLDKKYISKFSNVTFSPEAEEITETEYVFELGELQPGEKRIISGEIQSEKFGKFSGSIRASAGTATEAHVSLTTISYP